MTTTELGALVRGLAPMLREYVVSSQKTLSDRVAALETQDLVPKNGTLEDLRVEWVGDRILRFCRADGTVLSDRTVPLVIYRGVWDAARTYEAGDQVTCQGSTWIAKETTTQRPDDDGPGARAWTLCSKRGAVGPRGPEGKPGVAGKDGAARTRPHRDGCDRPQMVTTRPRTTVLASRVPSLCPGGTVVCLGGGPSLHADDVDYCRGKATVVAINDSLAAGAVGGRADCL